MHEDTQVSVNSLAQNPDMPKGLLASPSLRSPPLPSRLASPALPACLPACLPAGVCGWVGGGWLSAVS